MDILEIKRKERMPREQVAARLHELADQLSRHNDLEFQRDGLAFKVRVADEVELEVELEVADDGVELEIELSW